MIASADSPSPKPTPNFKEVPYLPRGGALEFWQCAAPEVLVVGPAGTGKSRAIGEVIYRDAMGIPGSRQAVVRKTRVSLTESWLVTWETKVVLPGHPCLDGPTRAHRTSYTFPNGSEIVVAGMDNPTRLFSTEFDRVYVNEATELSEAEWESIHRALRNGVMPYQQLVGDCNPDGAHHWLNRRCNEGKTLRIISRHEDNPSITPQYLERLASLTGVRRQRLYLGLWASAEGLIWDSFDPAKHVIQATLRRDEGPPARWYLDRANGASTELTWFFASVDWGFRAPGSLMVWGVDRDQRMYCVAEIYWTRKNAIWWAEQAEILRKRYDIQRFVCDSAEPDSIDIFNQRMGKVGGYWIAQPTLKRPLDFGPTAGLVRERLDNDGISWVADRHVCGFDPELRDAALPLSSTDEIVGYVYKEFRDGKATSEEPAPGQADHGLDSARYAVSFINRHDWQPADDSPAFPEGTHGAIFKHEDVKYD